MDDCLPAFAGRTRILYAKECGAEAMELEAEHQAAATLPGLWHDLEELAEQVDAGLHITKAAFAKQTVEQVIEQAELTRKLASPHAVRKCLRQYPGRVYR